MQSSGYAFGTEYGQVALWAPTFFGDNVDGAGYLQMLETFVIPKLIRLRILDFIYF